MADRPKLEVLPATRQTTGLPQAPTREPAFPGWGRPGRKLDSIRDAKRELSRIYRRAAVGDVDPQDLSRAVYALQWVAKLAEMEAQEERIARLESQLGQIEEATRHGR